jgi:hypothetical protein
MNFAEIFGNLDNMANIQDNLPRHLRKRNQVVSSGIANQAKARKLMRE